MRIVREIEVGGRKVALKELTLGDIRHWLAAAEQQLKERPDAVGLTLLEETSLDDIAFLTDLTVDGMDAMTPAELREVFAAAREVNADFFAMRRRLEALGLAMSASGGEISSAASAPS